MSAGLWVLLGSLGAVVALVVAVLLYGRSERARGRAETKAEEAGDAEEKRRRMAEIDARRLPRDVLRERILRLRERRNAKHR